MSRLTLGGVAGLLGCTLVLTGACGGSAFTADGAGLGNAGASQAGADSSGGSISSGGSGDAGATSEGGSVSSAGSISTSGSTSAGGSVSSAGSVSSGGSISSSGSMSGGATGSGGAVGSCAMGTLTFKLLPAKGTEPGIFCAGCSVNWLTVTNSLGKQVTIDRGCGVATCGSCSPTSCPPVACLNQSIPATGLSRDWDETQWVGSTCGATDLACVGAHCVPAGKYKAKMCALKNTTPGQNFCTVGDTPVCTEVQFELPTTATTVTGTIGG